MTTNAGAPEGAPTGTPTITVDPNATPEAKEPAAVHLTSAQLAERLDGAQKAERNRLLKELGFDSKAAADACVKSAKALSDAQLTEKDRIAKERDELKPMADRATALESRLKSYADREFAALPEGVQKAIDGMANGDAEKRLAQIEFLRSTGLLPTSPGVVTQPATPTVTAPTTRAPGAPTPPHTPPVTAYDKHKAMPEGLAKDLFANLNRHAIRTSTPSK